MRGADVDLTIRVDHSVSNSVFGRLDDTGQYPFGYDLPTGYPDESSMWQGSGPLIMSWRTVTYLLRRSEVANLGDQTNLGVAESVRTPINIVDFWMTRAMGYTLDGSVVTKLVDFVVTTSGVADNVSITPAVTNNTTAYSTYTKIIRGLVGLILMSPDAMRR